MKNCYRSWMSSSAANSIFTGLAGNARFVGGAVRDAMLGFDAEDIDIVTPLHPDEVISRLEALGIKTIPTGIKHGTVTALSEGRAFEITTLRRDINCYGRHAQVEFTDSWEEDAGRRDFTMNSMSCSPNGDLFDYFGGCEDLLAGRIIFVGEAASRCKEDYLRILRFFRFFAIYGKQPADDGALSACEGLAYGISELSGERIQKEMFKLLSASAPITALELMLQTGVIDKVIPSVSIDKILQLQRLLNIQGARARNPILRLAVLLHGRVGSVDEVILRWKLSNVDKARLLFIAQHEGNILQSMDEANAKKYLRKWGVDNFMDISLLEYAQGLDKQVFKRMAELQTWKIPHLPITGSDLIKLGMRQGQEIGRSLQDGEAWWEERNYTPGKQEILDFLSNKS